MSKSCLYPSGNVRFFTALFSPFTLTEIGPPAIQSEKYLVPDAGKILFQSTLRRRNPSLRTGSFSKECTMKPRRSPPPHLLLLLLAVLLAAGWKPCAEPRGTSAFRLEAAETLLDQPLLVQTGLPQSLSVQPARELPLENAAARPLRLRVAVPLPARLAPPVLPVPQPLRPSWRGLVSFPLPPPAAFFHA